MGLGPLPNVPQVFKCVDYGHIATHEVQTQFYFHWANGAPATAGDMDIASYDLGTALDTMYATTDFSHEFVHDATRATDLTSPSGASHTTTFATAGGASQSTHANAAVLISNQITRRYRGGHSRNYIAGMSDDNVNDGRTWIAAAVTRIQTAYNAAIAAVLAGGYTSIGGLSHVEVGYYTHDPVTKAKLYKVPPSVDVITTSVAHIGIRTQRRRLRNTPVSD